MSNAIDSQPAAMHTDGNQSTRHLRTLNLLCALGWHYLSPQQALAKRGNRRQALLHSSLVEVLQSRRYQHNGQAHLLTPNGIEQIVREVSSLSLQQGVAGMSAQLYDKLRLGVTITEFLPDGKKHQPTVPIIDWHNRKANRYEVCDMFEMCAAQGKHVRQAGLVCFVNGIPLALIETGDAAAPSDAQQLEQAMAQHQQLQEAHELAHLYGHAQLLFALGAHSGRYACSGAPHWSCWHEEQYSEEYLQRLLNTPLSMEVRNQLQNELSLAQRNQLKRLWQEEQQLDQAHTLVLGLLQPARLLEFLASYMLHDKRQGRLAAHSQQFFAVRSCLERISQRNERGARLGGLLWHAAGAGKTMCMAFLARAMLLHEGLKDCRILIISERSEVEAQMALQFQHCGLGGGKSERGKSRSGHELARRISSGNERIVFTQVQRFAAAAALDLCYNPSHQLVVLLDEGLRGPHAELYARMKKALPRAAFLAFSGSALLQREYDQHALGPLLHRYSMQQALQDGLIAPLQYEERPLPPQPVNGAQWLAASMHDMQTAERELNLALLTRLQQMAADARDAVLALDIALHFSRHVRPAAPGLKGMVLCRNKSAAIRLAHLLQASGLAHSALLLAAPEIAEGDGAEDPALLQAWQAQIESHFDNFEQYERQTLQEFHAAHGPDLLVVVEKSAPGAALAVQYLDGVLPEYMLLDVLHRCNRRHAQKQYGLLIDYRGQLAQIDSARAPRGWQTQLLSGYPRQDLEGLLHSTRQLWQQLAPLQQQLFALFSLEATHPLLTDKLREHLRCRLLPQYSSQVLQDQSHKLRQAFCQAFANYAWALQSVLSSRLPQQEAGAAELDSHLQSLRFFSLLYRRALQDANQSPDPRLLQLCATCLQRHGMSAQENVQEDHSWSPERWQNEAELSKQRLRLALEQELDDDPYARQLFQQRYAQALQRAAQAGQDWQQQHALWRQLEQQWQSRQIDTLPEIFQRRRSAAAYYGLFRLCLGEAHFAAANAAQQSAYVDQALAIDDVVQPALRENTLNPEQVESIIKSRLLPRLFLMLGMEHARTVCNQIVRIALVRGKNLRAE
ncbi:type I restriction endonuclease [Massilia sp. W12]|uniref:type I restriction endonuclease n=1 Tax=Massilia sp. W12 TaxID=3126507 RepID=UPI0030CD98E0